MSASSIFKFFITTNIQRLFTHIRIFDVTTFFIESTQRFSNEMLTFCTSVISKCTTYLHLYYYACSILKIFLQDNLKLLSEFYTIAKQILMGTDGNTSQANDISHYYINYLIVQLRKSLWSFTQILQKQRHVFL